jgi:hypothetical protein
MYKLLQFHKNLLWSRFPFEFDKLGYVILLKFHKNLLWSRFPYEFDAYKY